MSFREQCCISFGLKGCVAGSFVHGVVATFLIAGMYPVLNSMGFANTTYSDTDFTEWYVDRYGDLRADAVHHDGTNHYLYRVFKEGVTESQMERLQEKIYMGKATRADITRVTKRLGDEIGRVYGWDFPKSRAVVEREVG